jgi:hypothetical protein
MVTRKAFLIGCAGGYRDLSFLKGVNLDLKNYSDFLTSKSGGEWRYDEICTLVDPTSEILESKIVNSDADYTFVVYSGHGYINSYTSDDTICLKDKDVSISSLVSLSKKQTIIIDACREYYQPNLLLEQELKLSTLIDDRLKESTRAIFDEAIIKNPEGILLLFAAQPNQTAGDNELLGGVFSYSLLKIGKEFKAASSNRILTLDKALDGAKVYIKNKFNSNQTPTFAGQSRRLTFPPFAAS